MKEHVEDNNIFVHLEVDTCDAFNYETAKDGKYSVEDLKRLLINEIKTIKKIRIQN